MRIIGGIAGGVSDRRRVQVDRRCGQVGGVLAGRHRVAERRPGETQRIGAVDQIERAIGLLGKRQEVTGIDSNRGEVPSEIGR